MKIAYVLYPDFTALDLVGPYENPLPVLGDHLLIDWLRAAAPGCQWTASVCTGAGLYAAAGQLAGKATTTHWGFRDVVRAYDPQPPFDSGSLAKAHADTRRLAMSVLIAGQPRVKVAARMARTILAARVRRARRALSGQPASSRRSNAQGRPEQSMSGPPALPAPSDGRVAGEPREQSGIWER